MWTFDSNGGEETFFHLFQPPTLTEQCWKEHVCWMHIPEKVQHLSLYYSPTETQPQVTIKHTCTAHNHVHKYLYHTLRPLTICFVLPLNDFVFPHNTFAFASNMFYVFLQYIWIPPYTFAFPRNTFFPSFPSEPSVCLLGCYHDGQHCLRNVRLYM